MKKSYMPCFRAKYCKKQANTKNTRNKLGSTFGSVRSLHDFTKLSSKLKTEHKKTFIKEYTLPTISNHSEMPVSRFVPIKDATILSVAGWEVPPANGDMAVSRMSTPASIAA